MNARTAALAAAYTAGLALIALGLRGIVMEVPVARWAAWFAGAAILHDGVLVPAVLAAGLVTGLLPARFRRVVRAALVVAACVTAVALPLVLGYGRRAEEPSRLPLPYERNLLIVLGAIAAVAVCTAVARAVIGRRRIRGGGATRAPRPSEKGPST
ncbi:hypothetical protein [Actinomadura madurae]|uniref:hypothetical protein n=1 Tax=Actinomadura madurae TaxID=1993 RepID=UPI002025DCBA|nr:hypothetical protein [Actinomadura madurae]MCP9947664.1 hypothetical protein [Actinomadura madurae]MCP9964431.1 hypothetical protein [Actinomadura madurae]MCP9976914.1 hypothetical protein [Actinomadura madurae]MCQ0011590.1 hypothetical protein [Actinomadura madurae]MCQ0013098.1 hypothetical protein [Actinomadura madurae]